MERLTWGTSVNIGVCAALLVEVTASMNVATADEDSEHRRGNDREALVMTDGARNIVGPVQWGNPTLFIEIQHRVYGAPVYNTSPVTFTLPADSPVYGFYTSTDCSGTALIQVQGFEVIPTFAFIIGTVGYVNPTDQSTPPVTVRSNGYPPGSPATYGCSSDNQSGKFAPWQTVDLTSFLSRFTPPFSISVR
ncbi:MAG: hypothetical protein JO203_03360 [Gammaproteobacteria bacterium]|nr:hypothetical protein [Gammaproteobacteria bacterium]